MGVDDTSGNFESVRISVALRNNIDDVVEETKMVLV